jgi:Ca2+-binding RTX toxin-like protein
VVALRDGGFFVAWHDHTAARLVGQRFSATGAGVGTAITIANGGDISQSELGLTDDGRILVTFKRGTDISQVILDPREKIIVGDNTSETITSRIDGATVNGNGGNDTLLGQQAADVLNGSAGADLLKGAGGNDVYHVDSGGDIVSEAGGSGVDTVVSSFSFSLANTARVLGAVENLALGNVAAATSATGNNLSNVITGNNFANTLSGGVGNDTLNGGIGADVMNGGVGDDRFFVDNAVDKVFEAANQGTDTVYTSVSYALTAGRHIETLATTSVAGTSTIGLTGNELAQRIIGNNGVNGLYGNAGNDLLYAYGGNDVLNGGLGNDALSGGIGIDYFVFNTALSPTANVDRIIDFSVPADTIRLDNAVMPGLGASLGAAKFWKSTAGVAHDTDDRIIYDIDSGRLFYDGNGNAAGGVVHFATLAPDLPISHLDFQVI